MNKSGELEKLKQQMLSDKNLPLRSQATQLVFGEGNPDAKIYFLGEAPGFWEDQKGRPFVGQAGQLLDQLIESISFKRQDVYISNVVRYRPPGNRDPLPEELEAFDPYINQEIKIINPKIIVTLGRFSMGKFIPNVKISQVHGKARKINFLGSDVTVIPMFHPAAALRSSEVLKSLQTDFKLIPKMLNPALDKPSDNTTDKIPKEAKSNQQLHLL